MDLPIVQETFVAPGSHASWILVLVLAAFVFCVVKLSGRTLARLFGVGCVLLFCGLLLRYVSLQRGRDQDPGSATENAQIASRDFASALERDGEITTEALWQRLTKPRIPLDEADVLRASAAPLPETPQPPVQDEQEKTVKQSIRERPEWIDQAPGRIGNIYRAVVSSDPFSSVDECRRQLEGRLQEVIGNRMNVVSDGRYGQLKEVAGVGLDYIFREICRDRYTETSLHNFGELSEMKRVHVLLEFTPPVDKYLASLCKYQLQQVRMRRLVSLGFTVIAGLAGVFGLLKLDTWTHGSYTKQLYFGVPAVIIGIILLLTV